MSDEQQFTVVSEVYRNERRSKVLTKLPTDFYRISEEYLARQREEYSRAILIPSNPKTMMLQDQVKKVETRIKHIYDIRERKITLAALDSMGGSRPPDNMTRKDKELYELLVATLRSFREGVEPPAVPEKSRPEPKIKAMPKPEPEVVEQVQIVEPKPEVAETKEKEMSMIVQVLEDMPDFVGMEQTYNLKKNDMISLPNRFATLLSSKGKVRIVGT